MDYNEYKHRVYLLKETKGIYAFTFNKEYMKVFEAQRNMNKFIIKDIKFDDEIMWRSFVASNKNCMLQKDVLFDGKNTIDIICTEEESFGLDVYSNKYSDDLLNLQKALNTEFNVPPKYQKIISELTNRLREDESLDIDTFKLFFDLFKNTF